MAMPSIQVDDDDILMDYDDDEPMTSAAPANDSMMLDSTQGATATHTNADDDDEGIVPERVHIRGVDNVPQPPSRPQPPANTPASSTQHKSKRT